MNALKNWKTTVPGLLCVAMAALEAFGFDIPGFNMSLPEALTVGVGFFMASDAVKS